MKVPRTERPGSYRIKSRQRHMIEFGEYLKDKYTHIDKFDMIKDEKEARRRYHLTVSQAIQVWNKIYE